MSDLDLVEQVSFDGIQDRADMLDGFVTKHHLLLAKEGIRQTGCESDERHEGCKGEQEEAPSHDP